MSSLPEKSLDEAPTPPDYSSARASATAASITRAVEAEKSHAKEKHPLGKIDINTATEKELIPVPGIGHVMARSNHLPRGRSDSADDLEESERNRDKKHAQIRPYFQ